jgi:hypothetical protein
MLTLALILCAGCASSGGDNSLLADALFGDVASLFSDHNDSVKTFASKDPADNSDNSASMTPRAAQMPATKLNQQ